MEYPAELPVLAFMSTLASDSLLYSYSSSRTQKKIGGRFSTPADCHPEIFGQ
jgi:hypothetical protein